MYESTFQFNGRPFVAAPSTERYFPASAIEHARQTLARCVERAEGPGLLIGASGTGKSLVCHMLADQFRTTFRVVLLANARLDTRRALLQNILFELGLPYRDMDEGELRLSLIDHLEPSERCPHGMLLLADEAHSLPVTLLEEIRMISNLVRQGQSRVSLVLAGGPQLEEHFASPKLESLNQRIAARCYLDALNRDETCQYICAQIASVGSDASRVFSGEALEAVYQATDGIPRLVNQLCDHALMMTAVGGRTLLEPAGIEEAWADLQQLPTPWSSGEDVISFDAPSDSDENHVIEFGPLEPNEETETPQDEPVEPEISYSFELDPSDRLDEMTRQVEDAANDDFGEDEPVDDNEPTQFEETDTRPTILIGANTPQIEVEFQRHHDPFDEEFEEEEIVIDPYASIGVDHLSQRPMVSSQQSYDIAAALDAVLDAEPTDVSLEDSVLDGKEPVVTVEIMAEEHRPPMVNHEVSHDEPLQETHEEVVVDTDEPITLELDITAAAVFDPASDPVLPEYRDDKIEERQAIEPPIDTEEPVRVDSHDQVSSDDSIAIPTVEDDRDLIIVEDDGGSDPVRKPVHTPGKSRGEQYRRLFAKLRRG